MKRYRVWGLSAALVAGVGGPAPAGDPAPPLPEHTTLVDKLFGPKKPKPPAPAEKSGPVTIAAPLSPEMLSDALRAEKDAWMRRISVCDELRRMAYERDDKALLKQADELERQSAALYNIRVAALGVSKVKAPLPDVAPPSPFALDEPASVRATAKKLEAPAVPVPGTTTAQIREVKP